jgi:hypothetical protein
MHTCDQRRIKVVGGLGPTELDEQKKVVLLFTSVSFVILLYGYVLLRFKVKNKIFLCLVGAPSGGRPGPDPLGPLNPALPYVAAQPMPLKSSWARLERYVAANCAVPLGTADPVTIDQWRRVFCFMNNIHVFTGCSALTLVMKVVLHFVNGYTDQSRKWIFRTKPNLKP